jgi:hypothetical protein
MFKQLAVGLALLLIGAVMGLGGGVILSLPRNVEKVTSVERKQTSTCTEDLANRDRVITLHRATIADFEAQIARERDSAKESQTVIARERTLTARAKVAATICGIQRKDLWGKVDATRVYAWNVTADWAKAFYAEEKLRKAAERELAESQGERDGQVIRVKQLECEIAKLKRQPGTCPLK